MNLCDILVKVHKKFKILQIELQNTKKGIFNKNKMQDNQAEVLDNNFCYDKPDKKQKHPH